MNHRYPNFRSPAFPGPAQPELTREQNQVERPAPPALSAPQPEASRRDNHLVHALRHHLALCEEVMALTHRENQSLTAGEGYEPSTFSHQRKDLLPRLEESLMSLSTWRKRWQESGPAGRTGAEVVSSVSQSVQVLLTRILQLDRENQQALMRRGLLPAQHLPAAAVQRPHCVADAYRRHAHA